MELLADMVGILRRKPVSLAQHSRWGEWEDGVLAKLPNAAAAQRLIFERRGEADVEAATASTVEDYVCKRLTKHGYDPATQRIRIRSEIVAQWFNAATEQQEPVARVSAQLRQMADEGQLKRLTKNKSHKHARSFLWTGEKAVNADIVEFEPKKGPQ